VGLAGGWVESRCGSTWLRSGHFEVRQLPDSRTIPSPDATLGHGKGRSAILATLDSFGRSKIFMSFAFFCG